MRFGMSEKLGPRVLGRNHDQPFLGREMGNEPDYSDEIAREIDDEIRRIIEEAHRQRAVLREHMADLQQALRHPDRARDDRPRPVRAACSPASPKRGSSARRPSRGGSEPEAERKRIPKPKTKPFPIPGQAMQPPPPEPSGS